eukprot:353419-Chlamydomonas_euryale.AAC.3
MPGGHHPVPRFDGRARMPSRHPSPPVLRRSQGKGRVWQWQVRRIVCATAGIVRGRRDEPRV